MLTESIFQLLCQMCLLFNLNFNNVLHKKKKDSKEAVCEFILLSIFYYVIGPIQFCK